jgi:hypothetical protein
VGHLAVSAEPFVLGLDQRGVLTMNHPTMYRAMRSISQLAAIVTTFVVGGCKSLDSPDLNAVSLGGLQSNPTPSGVATATQGLLWQIRRFYQFPNIVLPGEFAREGFDLDPSNAQLQAQLLNALDPNVGFNYYSYRTLVLGSVILDAVDKVGAYSAADKEGVKGFTKTMEALSLMYTIQGLDKSGAALETSLDPTAAPPAIKSRDEVYQRITQLLDEAKTHLSNAGNAFAFNLSDGFVDFGTPGDFLKFNRALKARSDLYQASFGINAVTYARVLTDLNESFLDVTAPLSSGAYHTFSTNSGDELNQLNDPQGRQFFANPALTTDAQKRADNSPDLRYSTKIKEIDPIGRTGFQVTSLFVIYNSPSSPVPIIKNEELILMRAEALWKTGDRPGALADINLIRTTSGGLAPLAADPGDPGLRDELLYNRRYSLMWENGQRWMDMRRFNLLDQLPKQRAGDVVFPYVPIPADECAVRTPKPAGCTAPAGL